MQHNTHIPHKQHMLPHPLATLIALLCGFLALLLVGCTPIHSQARANTPPAMQVTPDQVTFDAVWNEPQVMTRAIAIQNTGSGGFTWTVSHTQAGSLWMGLSFSPTSGVNTGRVTLSLNSAGYPTGVITTLLHISAEPSTTLNSSFNLPVSLHVTGKQAHIFLPLVLRNHMAASAPTPTPPPPNSTPSPTASLTPTATSTSPPPSPTPSSTPMIHHLGLSFITSAQTPANELRFQRAAQAGASFDRWPFYWGLIETSDGVFDWSAHDAAVIADLEHSLQLDAILMMPPAFHRQGPCTYLAAQAYATPPGLGPEARRQFQARLPALEAIQNDCTTPARLDQPVFSDGTDLPGPGKSINSNNPWARFVYIAVMRYKPGGIIAAQRNWPAGRGVQVWEIWNEPDYTWFWNGDAVSYARAVAVAYMAARQADPQAKLMLGGISDVNQRPTWLHDVLDTLATYPYTQTQGWYFDAVGIHSYAWSWATFNQLYLAQSQLDNHGISGKTLWLNESGVPVWDDYPGPTWDPNSPYRATMQEQADYVIQSAIYAAWMEAEAMFHFQLYDDCGNGPDAHDAFGLRRNDAAAVCYPSDEAARPSLAAYQTIARYLPNLSPRWRWRPPDGGQEWIAFYDPVEGNRVVALWARTYINQTAILSATSPAAVLVGPDGMGQRIEAVDGRYTLSLAAATNHNTATNDGSAPIGGRPLLLIELDASGTGGPEPTDHD